MTWFAAALLGVTLALVLPAPRLRSPPTGSGVVAAGGVAVVAVLPYVPPGAVVLGLAALLGVVVTRRRTRAAQAEDRRRSAVADLCESVAADLRSGLTPTAALAGAATDWPELLPVLGAARVDADVTPRFLEIAEQPGAESLRWVAAAWAVSQRSGAALALTLDRIGRAVDAETRTVQLVETELASVRATAKLLAALPVGVLVVGRGVGGDPVGFLLDSAAGLACLVAGLALVGAGLVWVELIAAGVRRC